MKGPYHTYKEIDAPAWYMSKTKKTKNQQPRAQSFSCGRAEIHAYRYTGRSTYIISCTSCTSTHTETPSHSSIAQDGCFRDTQTNTQSLPTKNNCTPPKNREVRQTPICPPCALPPLPLCRYAACQATGKRSRRLLAKLRELVKQWTCTSEKISVGLRGLNN